VNTIPVKKTNVMNILFTVMVMGSILTAAANNSMEATTNASFEGAKQAAKLALELIGVMAFWLGLVQILEKGGAMQSIVKLVKPLMVKLFPDVPPEHPAMGAMVLNIAANMLGLGNAATPIGIKAMIELNRLNTTPGRATNAMCLFLAINTSSVTLLPLGTIGVRAAAGSASPAAIIIPTLLATTASTLVAILVSKLLADPNEAVLPYKGVTQDPEEITESNQIVAKTTSKFKINCIYLFWMVILIFLFIHLMGKLTFQDLLSFWLVPLLIGGVVSYGLLKEVPIYDTVIEGAKQGFDVAIKILPFLVAILASIAMVRASGMMEVFTYIVSPVTELIGMPAEVVPVAAIRPLSGSGAFALMSALINENPDSFASYMASVVVGCTETTFYVLAVYFGAVGIVQTRYAVTAGITADLAGILVTVLACHLLYYL
jgi:spore maturation protein SpmA